MNKVYKILLNTDDSGNIYLQRAWSKKDVQLISDDSEVRPVPIIQNDKIVGFDALDLDIVFPEFEPFEKDRVLHFFSESKEVRYDDYATWMLTMRLLKTLKTGEELAKDYKQRLEILDREFDKQSDDPKLKEVVMESLHNRIEYYKKYRAWDLTPQGVN